MTPKWKRWVTVLAGGTLAQAFAGAGQSCRVNVPGNINVQPPNVVVDADVDDDDDGDCILADCD